MAGVITRFKDIMSANINALLDKAEDPEKMINQYLRNLESDLGNVKAETAAVMAAESKAKRELEECSAEAEKMQKYAEKAVLAGNDDDARVFLQKKKDFTEKLEVLQKSYELACANATQMKQMHDKLVSDIGELNARKDSIKAKMAVAKTQQTLNKIGASIDGAKGNLSQFDRMEEKVNKMYDESMAMAELNAKPKDGIEDLMNKYNDTNVSSDIEDELAALKRNMQQ